MPHGKTSFSRGTANMLKDIGAQILFSNNPTVNGKFFARGPGQLRRKVRRMHASAWVEALGAVKLRDRFVVGGASQRTARGPFGFWSVHDLRRVLKGAASCPRPQLGPIVYGGKGRPPSLRPVPKASLRFPSSSSSFPTSFNSSFFMGPGPPPQPRARE